MNIPFLATKNLPSLGSIPANTAGAPSHLTVTSLLALVVPANISLKSLKANIAARAPVTPPSITISSIWTMCVFLASTICFLKFILEIPLFYLLEQLMYLQY